MYKLPFVDSPPSLTAKRVKFIVDGVNNASAQHGLRLQDTVLVLNTWDEPRCTKSLHCTMPVFSLIKQWDWRAGRGLQSDVLLPFFSHFYGDVIDTPWDEKIGKALMRAAAQNGMHRNCTRLWLLELARSHPVGQRLLDVGITNNLKKGLKVDTADYVDIPSHAKWKYLLSTDGFTASCRFGKLLQTNSVVLKEESRWIEYYYRSVHAGTHFYSFTKDNVLQVLLRLEASPPSELQSVTRSAQAFGYRHLSTAAKALYVARVIELHNACFQGVMEFVAGLPDGAARSLDALLDAARVWRA
uniref:Glycosyl transferase CAP10 domain-containing protein n=1 Tax=Chlamydomonas euryale TaxID=1486919 RepID=A0A7R9YW00_9CHLO|mmetsp:Transcript_29558/g.87433  ORF Transcript_29558/g.87433 Transcript_29558/m.87433 type:complete len:300 (+) Transcript_29558:298-1197(+)